MRKLLAIIITAIFSINITIAQITINRGFYTVYYSPALKTPLNVSYKLYKGGGKCDRHQFSFILDNKVLTTATFCDYDSTPFQRGLLIDPNDFAYDCELVQALLRYYICLPQTSNLYRGVWRDITNRTRQYSQKDSVLIYAGGIYNEHNVYIGKHVAVPEYCFKVVQSLTSKEILFCGIFTNLLCDNYYKIVTLDSLEKRIGYKLKLKE